MRCDGHIGLDWRINLLRDLIPFIQYFVLFKMRGGVSAMLDRKSDDGKCMYAQVNENEWMYIRLCYFVAFVTWVVELLILLFLPCVEIRNGFAIAKRWAIATSHRIYIALHPFTISTFIPASSILASFISKLQLRYIYFKLKIPIWKLSWCGDRWTHPRRISSLLKATPHHCCQLKLYLSLSQTLSAP